MKTNRFSLTLSVKKLFFAAAIFSSATALLASNYELGNYEIHWTGSMPAKTHEGLLSLSSFEADIDDSGVVRSLKAVVDMTSINVTDLEGRSRTRLTNHLLSEDFFHAEEYPTATFVLSEHKEERLHGTLTIRGIDQKVALPVRVSGAPERGWLLVGSFNFDRNDYNVDYQNSGFLGIIKAAQSKLIRDLIDVRISVRLNPPEAQ